RPRATRLRHAPLSSSLTAESNVSESFPQVWSSRVCRDSQTPQCRGLPDLGFRAVAEVHPLQALHYDLARVRLAQVIAPPYDVIDEEQRSDLEARSDHNVVELDLPSDPGGGDPYAHAGRLLQKWIEDGILIRDDQPAIWALEQDFTAPDGSRLTRRGLLARVRLAPYGQGIRPHERTQPGPREDRLRLTRATRLNLSPIFALHPGDAWQYLEPALEDLWGEVTD